MKRLIWPVTALIIMTMTLSGCVAFDNFKDNIISDNLNDKTVRIGIFEPLTGADAEYGKLEKRGIELAHDLYPTVLGKRVELIAEDNKSDPDYSEVAAEKLIKKKVAIVLGSYGSSNSLIGGVLFEKAKIPSIAITCTNPLVTSINEYYFRVCFIDTFQGIVMAKHAFEHDNALKAAILEESDNDYSVTLAQVFEEKFKELTGDENAIVSITKYTTEDQDFSSQLNAIRTSMPDVIYIPGKVSDAARIMKQAKESGITADFLGISDWESKELIDIAGKMAEGATYSTAFDPAVVMNDMTQVFLNEYKAKYGDKIPSREEALGFDAYLAAINSIERGGTATDGEAVKAALMETKQLPGVTGEITFDANGDAIKPVVIKTVQNGEFVYINKAIPVWE